MNNPYLFHGLEVGPVIVRRLVTAIGFENGDLIPDPARFTLREAIAHLADWEAIDLGRIRQAIERPGTPLQPYDEDQRAIDQNYGATDVKEQLELFEQRRKETIAYLRSLSEAQWRAEARHAEKGALTVYDQANLVLGHDTFHIEHLTLFL